MITRSLLQQRGISRWSSAGVIMGAALIVLVGAPFLLSNFQLNLLGKFLAYALVAIGLDLLWGYAGILSLGQGLFFGLGAYAMAMYLKLEASGKSLPDFMIWSGRTDLPLFWRPFASPVFAMAMVVIVPMVLGGLIGYVVFRSRIQGVYFSLITQALTLLTSILLIGQQPLTGGTNGLTDLRSIFGFPLADGSTQTALYLATVVALVVVYLLCLWITRSRLGRLLVALRDDEDRLRFLGYNPVVLKSLVFALSAGIAGLAGALFVAQVGIISPSIMAVVLSVEMVIWVAVGGRGTLVGAIVGVLLVNWGKSTFSAHFPDSWQYLLGGLFIGAVLLFPMGVVGAGSKLAARIRLRMRTAEGIRGRETVREPVARAAHLDTGVELPNR